MLKKLFVVVLLLAAVSAVAATADPNTQPATPEIKTYLMPDLTFMSVFSLDLLQPSEAVAAQPDTVAAARPRTGFCRCSCGFPCSTDADCGGASCDKFISCCARKAQSPDAGWFTRSFESSSHKTAQPDAVLKEIVKAECK